MNDSPQSETAFCCWAANLKNGTITPTSLSYPELEKAGKHGFLMPDGEMATHVGYVFDGRIERYNLIILS